MSILFFDGFETYATADVTKDWSSSAGAMAINSSGGRRSGGAAYIPNASTSGAQISKTLASAISTVIVGFAFYYNTAASTTREIVRLQDSGTNQIEIRLNTDGTVSVTRNGTVLDTSAASLSINTWNYIELKATIHDTTGSYDLRFNGASVLSATNVDTKNTANATVNGLSLGPVGSLVNNCTWRYDDLYIADTAGSAPNNTFLGDVRIDAVYPTGDGNYTQWTPSTGSSHYALVDDTTPNTTDYNSSSNIGDKDSYVMSDPASLTSEIIHAVRVKVAALKDDAGSRSIKVGVRSGTTDSVSSAQALTTSQMYYSHILETDPNTSAAWTPSGVNAMEALVESA